MSKSRKRPFRRGQWVAYERKVWHVQKVLRAGDLAGSSVEECRKDGYGLLLAPATADGFDPASEVVAVPSECRPSSRAAKPSVEWTPDRTTLRRAERVARRTAARARSMARQYRSDARKLKVSESPQQKAMLREWAKQEHERAEALSAFADYLAWGDFDATGDIDR